MAGIEKICEYSGDYEGGVMYADKHNHIQVLKKHRHNFKDKDAYLFIVDKPEADRYLPSLWWWVSFKLFGKYYHFSVMPRFWSKDWWIHRLSPFRPQYYRLWYHYILWVPDVPGQVEGLYYNWTYHPGKVVRNLRKLVNLHWVHYPSYSTNQTLFDAVRKEIAYMEEQENLKNQKGDLGDEDGSTIDKYENQ